MNIEIKCSAEETLGLGKIKRSRLVDVDVDGAVGEDGSLAVGDMDGDDDGSDWDAPDNSDCSLDTSYDDDKGDDENLATISQELKE